LDFNLEVIGKETVYSGNYSLDPKGTLAIAYFNCNQKVILT
jgi:hypothetical protein